MIRAMIFDLDGTLVQTERLKALSYARAAVQLCPRRLSESEVIEAFKEVVGRPRREVALALVGRFDLEGAARACMSEFGVSTPWQAFVQVRLHYYEQLLSDPQVLLSNRWMHNVEVLNEARRNRCKVALATMSHCRQVQRILEVLGLVGAFHFVATRDDVEWGKPHPEIYQLVSRELDVPPRECLVIEDSPAGVKAAQAAGMWCIVVTTPFTREVIHGELLLDGRWVVDEPGMLMAVVQEMLEERRC